MIARFRGTAWGSCGTTLIELLAAITIGTMVLGILYMLVDASARSRAVVNARVADTEQGRQVLAWMADRLRQARYDSLAACPEGLILMGSGDGFPQRLAFRAVLDETVVPGRRIFAFYREGGTLWQETRAEDAREACDAEAMRTAPDPNRTALTAPIVKTFALQFFGPDGRPATSPAGVRSIGITLRLEAPAIARRVEGQTFNTSVTIRGP